MMLVSALIIMVILTMLIRADIMRQRLDLGVYKGLGYTTRELMLQISMSLMPTIAIGIILGSLLALWCSPFILSQAFSVIGGTHITVEMGMLTIILLDISILVFSFAIAMLSTYRIKEISVYELLTE